MSRPIDITFEYFAQHTIWGNSWCYEPRRLRLYVRRTWPQMMATHGDFQIANVFCANMGQGVFTAFLARWRPVYRLYVENVQNPRFYRYLERNGFKLMRGAIDDGGACFLGELTP